MQELLERTEAGSFAEFVAARSNRLLRVAYLLTRDWALAEDLLQTSLAKAWSAWPRIEGDPEPYVRKILVNTYTTWWRRRWNSERPTEVLPERPTADEHGSIDERDQIRRALTRLPRQQRAVLVLRYYEDLSEVEIAETLGISPGTVKSHAFKGLANLRLDASLAAAHFSSDEVEPAGTARLAAVTERVQHRRRQRVAAVVAACAVVLAAILGYAIRPAHRSAPQPATTPSPATIGGFQRYQMGRQVVVAGSVSAQRPVTTLTWPATTTDISFFLRCSAASDEADAWPDVTVWIDFQIGTHQVGRVGCAGPSTGSNAGTWPSQTLRDAGLRAGSPGQVTIRIDAPSLPAGFVADIGIGEAVAPEDYPYPTAPASLPALMINGFDQRPGAIALRPGPDPLALVSADIVWGDWDFHSTLDAPGEIILSVNGVTIQTCSKWDYAMSGCGAGTDSIEDNAGFTALKLRPGDHVRITVTPVRVGHSWTVWAAPHVTG